MEILLDNGKKAELPKGATARDVADQLNLKAPDQALAAEINGTERDLNHPLSEGDQLHLLSFDEPKGKAIFWHTSAHLLAQAVLRLWPDAQPTIGPPIAEGFYYDFANLSLSEEDFPRIEREMQTIVEENHRSERQLIPSKEHALEVFSANPYKCELIKEVPEGEEITAYRQGEFVDLCRGPHLDHLGKIKAFKLLKTAGAYWRGDASREMLTRIYAISFPDRKQLKVYLERIEEAKKRDHRLIGQKLDLFSMHETAAGMPFIHPKGMVIWNELVSYLRLLQSRAGYIEIRTPLMLGRELWERSGHWENYQEHMFLSDVEKQEYVIKPMNCPGCMLYYGSHNHSYRELPIRIAEIGNVHRYEPSGALSGLFRVRSFHQDDAHIFMEPSQIQKEVLGTLNLADRLYSTFGLKYHIELSTRPEKQTIGSDEQWRVATEGLSGALDTWGHPYKLNPGDGAFYGPKIDFHIRDAIGRTWQCGTVQLDMALPERFDLHYTAQDGSRPRPVMIHRALYGSIERFLAILIEHFAGKFPLWLSPYPIRLITVADRHIPYAETVAEKLLDAQFHCEIDRTDESVGKKIRTAQLLQTNYILTVGDREMEHQTLSVRTRDNIVHGEMALSPFLELIVKEKESRSLTSSLSKQEK